MQGDRERGFTLVELMVSTMILGSIIGVIGLVFTVTMQSSEKVREMLPGARAANSITLYLSSDVSSAVPVDLDSWLSTDPKAASGCSGDSVDDGTNILRVESRSATDPELTYVASYRFVPPAAGSGKGEVYRVFCRSGEFASSRSKVAEGIDPNDPPVVTVSEGNRSVEVLFRIWSSDSSASMVSACKGATPTATVSPRCPYEVRVRAAIRTAERAPAVVVGTATTLPVREPCQFVEASMSVPTRVGKDPGPLDDPVAVFVRTNESNGAQCRALVLKVPAVAGAQCELSRKGADGWTGSCFGAETGTVWPKTPSTFAAFVFDRVYPGTPKSDPPIDIDVPGGDLTLSVRTLVAPVAPTGLVVKPKDKSLQVSWIAPVLTPDTAPITSYVVTASPGSSTCTTAALTCTLTGLTNGTTYNVTVRAINRAGTGPGVSANGRPWPPLVISGTVFEDPNYGGGAGRSREIALGAGGTGSAGVLVELYEVVAGSASYLEGTSTDPSGNYSFLTPKCTSCAVRVVTSSVTSGRTGSTSGVRAVLTSGVAQAGAATSLRSDMVGGTNPSDVDGGIGAIGTAFSVSSGTFSAGTKGTAQAFTTVDETIADGSGLHFGFSFDTVTNTNDAGPGSLRQVITNANTLGGDASLAVNGRSAGVEHVVFMLPNATTGSGGSLKLSGGLRPAFNAFTSPAGPVKAATISLASGSLTVASPLVVDAQTQPGWSGSPIVEVNAATIGFGSDGALTLAGGGSTVRGLIVNRSPRYGISVPSSKNLVQGNYIGTDASGSAASANNFGVVVTGNANTIGGVETGEGNVISGNGGAGVYLLGGSANAVTGNLIGLNALGGSAVPNLRGVRVDGGTGHTIGGATVGAGNTISGNGVTGTSTEDLAGVYVHNAASGLTIAGNTIGLGTDRTAAVANSKNAIFITGSSNVTVGGVTSASRNVIAGNASHGVYVNSNAAAGVTVRNNWIGLAGDGTTPRGNGTDGVVCWGGTSDNCNVSDNVIAQSGRYGIWLGTGAGHVVKGNFVGTDAAGLLARPNNGGIYVSGGAAVSIGGTTAADRNVVSANNSFGVRIEGAGAVTVQGTSIGSNSASTATLANNGPGVSIVSSSNVVVGGSTTGSGNLITANTGGGVIVSGSSTANAILGNAITVNTGLGIDLGANGVTTNDGAKSAGQPNLLTDYPTFTSAALSGSALTVSGYVGTAAGQVAFANHRVEVFKSDNDTSGNGEAAAYIGFVTTDKNGNFQGPITIPAGVTLATGTTKVTGTATDTSSNTSEFGTNFTVGANGQGASMWVDASDIDGDGNDGNEPAVDSSIGQLTDKSGNGRHFVSPAGGQPTLISSPSFTRKVLRFSPSQWMRQSYNFAAPSTVIYVARARTAGSGRILQGVANNWLLGWWGNLEGVAYHDGWVSYPGPTATQSPRVMSSVIRGSGQPTDVFVDGIAVASNTSGQTGPNGLAVNSGGYAGETTDAEVAEILVFPRVMDPAERLAIETGLAAKWGISTSNMRLAAASATTQPGTNGVAVATPPKVLVTGFGAAPAPGVNVLFTAGTGGRVGGALSVTLSTDANGIATVPSWVPGSSVCIDRLTATSVASSDVVRFTVLKGGCPVPYGVSGASMWVDASDTDGDANAANEPALDASVMQLTDKTGNDRNFDSAVGKQPTLIASPAFSKNVLRFTTAQWMKQTYDFGAPSTVIYVARSRTTGNGRILQGVANNWLLGWWNGLERVAYHDGWISYPGVTGTTNARVVSSVIRGGGQPTEISVDGIVVTSNTGGQTGPNGLAVNTGNVAGGEVTDAEVAEILVFPRALTSTERSAIEVGLSTKWGPATITSLTATTPTSQAGANGTPAATPPKVRAAGFAAAPAVGVSVTFTAGAGGRVGGASSVTVLTDANGIATAPAWIPGSPTCSDRLTATTSGSPDVVKFSIAKGGCPVPYGVTGPAMWVDASDTDGDASPANEPALNAGVLSLIDKSGNIRDFDAVAGSQPTLVSSPAFAKNVLRFTPSQWMKQTANFGSPSTVIYVARARTTSSNRILQAIGNNWLLGWWSGQEERAYMDGWVQLTGVASTTKARIMSAVVRGSGATDFAVDGIVTSSNSGGVSGPNGLGVNGGGAYPGEATDAEVGEILVFPRALTNTERLAVESGLAAKWGVVLGQTLSAATTLTPVGTRGQVVPASPQVRLTLADGTNVAGATVTFTVSRGGGTVGGNASANVVTNASGLATSPSWLLSSAAGYQDLTATSPLTKTPVVFTADTGACPAYGICTVPAMWVDASDTDGDGVSSNEPALGSSILQLADKSGNNRPFTSQAGSQPTMTASSGFSKPVLGFTPSQWMRQTYDFGSPSTVIYVARARTASSGRILSSIGNNWLLGWHGNLEGVAYFNGWVAYPGPTHTTTGRVMSAVIRGEVANSDFAMDGVVKAANTSGVAGPNGLTINNSGENSDAEVAEIVVFPRVLSDAERFRVETGLAAKWGLAVANPVTSGLVSALDANNLSSMYQTSAGTTPVTATGQPVCRWTDLSGTGNHAVQPTTGSCPTYGTDAVGGFLNFSLNGFFTTSPTLSPDATVLVVAQSNTSTWNNYGWLASARGPNGFIVHPAAGSTNVDFYPVNSGGSYTYVGSLASPTLMNPTLYKMTMSGSNPVTGSYGLNGSSTSYSAAGVVRVAGSVLVTLGRDGNLGRPGNGRYREVLMYNRALSPAELTQVETYLRAKWGTG